MRILGKSLIGLTLVLLLAAATAAEDRASMIRRASDVLGVTQPIDVVLGGPARKLGEVTGGFMWGANGKMLKWAYDGQLERARRVGESVNNYLYLGASYPTLPQAHRLQIGSEEELALRDALELFCEDVLPQARFDSLDAELKSGTRRPIPEILESLTEKECDALRLWPVLRAVADQAKLVGER